MSKIINSDILLQILHNFRTTIEQKISNVLNTDQLNKINTIVITGDGSKLLTDNGTYMQYRTMTSDEVTTTINNILAN